MEAAVFDYGTVHSNESLLGLFADITARAYPHVGQHFIDPLFFGRISCCTHPYVHLQPAGYSFFSMPSCHLPQPAL
ncbi:hypothetical protein D3C84_1093680 [compost metagenome]